MKDLIKDGIYYGSFLVFPWLLLLYIYRKKVHIVVYVLLLLWMLIFMYSRFIETQIITISNTSIEVWFSSKIALIWDTHLWRYKGRMFLDRLVNKLNKLDVDYVFIAGDLTYEPEKWELEELFWAFDDLKHETYWVLWNHDVERPGPRIREELIRALDKENFHYLNNNIIVLGDFTLVWLGSNWNNEDDTGVLSQFIWSDNIVTLMHNPDSLSKFPMWISDITFAWHTHWGQIRLPFLYKKVIPTQGIYDKGYTQEKESKLFITSGMWEIGLPMRILNPPVIDVINLK